MIGVALKVDELPIANRTEGTASAGAIAADVGVFLGVDKLPLGVGLDRVRRRLGRQLERHRGGERGTRGFEEAPAGKIHSYSSSSRFRSIGADLLP